MAAEENASLNPRSCRTVMDHASPPRPAIHRAAVFALLALLALGLGWLAYNVERGMGSGRDSDLYRRWVVTQFVRAGVNPYPLALAALRRNYGPLGGARDKPRVYAVPRLDPDDPAADASARPLLAAHRTPEAVYPPSADLLLSTTLGFVPERAVHLAGLLANVTLLAVCTVLLGRPAGTSLAPLGLVAAAVVVLVWSPTQSAVYAGQFSILVTVCVLLAVRCLDRNEYLAGAWLGLALIKPSLALPFLILPLVRGRWRTLAVAAGLHTAGTVVQAARFGVNPVELLRQWTAVAAYFTQGQFTLQEVLSALRLADTPAGFAVIAGFVLLGFVWCVANRAADDATLVDLLCFVSVLWTYHGPYDFVILLVPVARRLVTFLSTAGSAAGWPIVPSVALTLFIVVSVACSPAVYGDEFHFISRVARHAARLLLVLGFAGAALRVWRSARPRPAGNAPVAFSDCGSREPHRLSA
jgi:hypothetical protein